MTHDQIQILRELKRRPQSTRQMQGDRDFSVLKRDLDSLKDDGSISISGSKTWHLTKRGWSMVGEAMTPSRSFCNYSQTEPYALPTWPNNRVGSNAHQSIESRGVSC